jgi:hypothetical protein
LDEDTGMMRFGEREVLIQISCCKRGIKRAIGAAAQAEMRDDIHIA